MDYLLLADNNLPGLQTARAYFELAGYAVYIAQTRAQALECFQSLPIDCAILSAEFAQGGGFALCKTFKAQSAAPVIFISHCSGKETLYQAFAVGGDDFVSSPLDLRELCLRVQARVRQYRQVISRQEILNFFPLAIDTGRRQAFVQNVPVPLTACEFEILLLLAHAPEHVFSLENIYREVWHLPDLSNARTVKVHVARLRQKLKTACPGHTFIGTLWKQGYYFLPAAKPIPDSAEK